VQSVADEEEEEANKYEMYTEEEVEDEHLSDFVTLFCRDTTHQRISIQQVGRYNEFLAICVLSAVLFLGI